MASCRSCSHVLHRKNAITKENWDKQSQWVSHQPCTSHGLALWRQACSYGILCKKVQNIQDVYHFLHSPKLLVLQRPLQKSIYLEVLGKTEIRSDSQGFCLNTLATDDDFYVFIDTFFTSVVAVDDIKKLHMRYQKRNISASIPFHVLGISLLYLKLTLFLPLFKL